MKRFLSVSLSIILILVFQASQGFALAADADITSTQPVTANQGNRYQGSRISVRAPGRPQDEERNLTTQEMIGLMGSNQAQGVQYASSSDVASQLKNFWLSNSSYQITKTFQSFQCNKRSVDIRLNNGIKNYYGSNTWAECVYYGYGKQGSDNHMRDISITIDLDDCLNAGSAGKISGYDDGYYCFDQIVAHELMHAYLAEIAPGYVLGDSHSQWFTEGIAEMANGGVKHMDGRSTRQLWGGIGQGTVDYGGSYLAVAYASWLSANAGYGQTCTVTAGNLAYGLDRILSKLRETGNLDRALTDTIGMSRSSLEAHLREQAASGGDYHPFHSNLLAACRNSEGIMGAGSLIGGNLKLQKEYVVSNNPRKLSANDSMQFVFQQGSAV